MTSFEALHTLVQSLSKAEKRYFKLFCDLQTGDKIYFALYQLLEKEQSTDAVMASISQKYPAAVIDTARKHLYRMLMKSLRSYESDRSIENRLMQRIQDIKILFNKGLLDLCFGELERAMELALKHEKFSYYLILARLELQYLTLLEFPDTDENALIAKQEKMNQVLHQEQWINRHSTLDEVLLHRYLHSGLARSQQEINKLDDLLLEEFQIISNKHYHSVLSQKLHLHFQSTYFLMTGNHPESLRLFYQLLHLFQEYSHLLHDSPLYYIYLINGILTDLRSMRQYAEMPFFIQSLQKIEPASESLGYFLQHLVYLHQLVLLLDLGDYPQAATLIQAYQKDISTKGKIIPPNSDATIHLLMALVYFGLQQFSAALHQVNYVLHKPRRYISHQVYSLCRLLRLIIQVELKNDDYLHYELRSVERKLKAEEKLFKTEKLTIQFLKKWIAHNRSPKYLELFFRNVKETTQHPYENQLLLWFDIVSWTEAKLTKKTYAQIVRAKQKVLV
ncbi:hypothetical protein [Adhaeribacter pallidiroseus]|uniref:Uncharacterized protein n=1 Tax=Adhaeribacter pallidiroseus TaxID=2072847 RepID=A0A369QES8_9BACT|nr:hypothetical protein [Adhaeribacter pallidiroseus]RDC61747.1 hypothetical protein AHMF7616_00329 [Adhaeribacter pallidiroseus]